MKQKKMMKRVLLFTLSLLLLVGALVSCGGGTTVPNTDWEVKDGDENCRHYFVRILTLGAALTEDAREMFVAASYGYNMKAEGFDDDNLVIDPEAVTFVDADGVTHTVSMAGAKAAMNSIKPTSDAAVAKFDALLATMTEEDVCKIVDMMRTEKVDLSGNSFPGIILEWIGLFLGLLTNITGGYYVLALFIFALVVELALLYFGIKQQKNSIKQAKLRPKEMAIRKKYAGRTDQKSQQAMQQELQKFYQDEGASPLSGCLPLLIQIPIVISLYNIVINPLRYVLGKGEGVVNALTKYATTARAAGGLGIDVENTGNTIELLSQIKDPAQLEGIKNFAWFSNSAEVSGELTDVVGNLPNFNLFGLNMGATPAFNPADKVYLWLLLIPLLTFVAYFFSMKLTRKFTYQPAAQDPQMGCSNNMMDLMMPAMSVYITFITPAAVGVYWIFKCLITTLKQFILHKAMPMPTFTEEDYKRAEREMKGKLRPEERELPERTGPVRSLHRIDEEDDLPARTRDDGEEEDSIYERRAKEAAAAREKSREAAEQRRLGGAKMKEDRKNNKKK
ncbi:MAG: YidC/Oxa1 family membrane protein insertase [Ruminococcaceae bacterium]|nr:YidC/Oxa1 family membrane protein insertase [Oscillospiraceae bacterium]